MPSADRKRGSRRGIVIDLRAGDRSSSIRIRQGALGTLRESREQRPSAWIVDAAVWRLHRNRLLPSMVASNGRAAPRLVLKGGEQVKTPEQLAAVWRWLAKTGLSRDGILVGVGGGTILDLAGFAAATWMRGVTSIAVPTTLLAAADASVGGKTAVDLDGLKNPVGAFHTAQSVLIDPEFLGTLTRRDWRCGLAEVVKGAVIGDPMLFRALEEAAPELRRLLDSGRSDRPVDGILSLPWHRWLEASVKFKARLVAQDYREQGPRRALNLGHTLAHALEPLLGIPHGEAVALGTAAVTRAALDEGICSARTCSRIIELLDACGLATSTAPPPLRQVKSLVNRDKKKAGGTVGWVLPAKIGKVLIDQPLELRHVLGRLRG